MICTISTCSYLRLAHTLALTIAFPPTYSFVYVLIPYSLVLVLAQICVIVISITVYAVDQSTAPALAVFLTLVLVLLLVLVLALVLYLLFASFDYVPALISTIENFLDIHGTANRSGDFTPNLLESKILEKKSRQGYHLLPWQHSF